MHQEIAHGLEGIVVAETELSRVDGERGILVLRGHRVERVGAEIGFEGLCHLLWEGRLATEAERLVVQNQLAQARMRAWSLVKNLAPALALPDAMEALRACVAQMSEKVGGIPIHVQVTGAIPVFASAWLRTHQRQSPLAPDSTAPHAEDFVRMSLGEPSKAKAKALETYLVTVSDHGMNASTFTARVVASTGSDTVSSVVAAIGALKGPLHGGAPGPVLDMLDAIGTPEQATSWLEAELHAGRRIMGMGHRVYRVRDPRAAALEMALERLKDDLGEIGRLRLARAVEQEAESLLAARYPDRPLRANVEFYTATLLEAIGLPRALFSATFCAGRVVGWCAHIHEQRSRGRLIRPRALYIGPSPAR